MKLEQSFEVAAPLERVWAALIDVEHVAPCLPGAAVTGREQDGSYHGTFGLLPRCIASGENPSQSHVRLRCFAFGRNMMCLFGKPNRKSHRAG